MCIRDSACTGEIGFANAKKMAELTAKELKVKAEEVFVALSLIHIFMT